MSKTTITYERANELMAWLQGIDPSPKDKLSYAMGRLREQLEKKLKVYARKMGDIGFKHSLTDKNDGSALMYSDNKGYKLDPEKLEKYHDEVEKLNQKNIEIDLVMSPPIKRVNNLPINILMVFNGILFEVDIEKLYSNDEDKQNEGAVPTTPEITTDPTLKKLEKEPVED